MFVYNIHLLNINISRVTKQIGEGRHANLHVKCPLFDHNQNFGKKKIKFHEIRSAVLMMLHAQRQTDTLAHTLTQKLTETYMQFFVTNEPRAIPHNVTVNPPLRVCPQHWINQALQYPAGTNDNSGGQDQKTPAFRVLTTRSRALNLEFWSQPGFETRITETTLCSMTSALSQRLFILFDSRHMIAEKRLPKRVAINCLVLILCVAVAQRQISAVCVLRTSVSCQYFGRLSNFNL